MTKPIASLSLDLDNKWSYLKTHGNGAWKEFPSYLDVAVPRILGFLREHSVKITFFVVGQDAALSKNRDALSKIALAGHQIASHSFNHEPWLHLYEETELENEFAMAEQAIEDATGARVIGFRGPGFSISNRVLKVLSKRGYRYDATAFPNILNPLARAYFFAKSDLTAEEKEQRKALFGNFSDAFRPVKPYRWDLDGGPFIELPVTTMPIFKTPIHFSYLLYLSGYSKALTKAYFGFAMLMCRITHTEPSLLLHPLDFLGADDDPDLGFFPGMGMSSAEKLGQMHELFNRLAERFTLVSLEDHIDIAERREGLPIFQPNFSF
jgi:peptidoglycan/xylan/chitin deacetylase (PgdA/CDA1 family)